MTPVTSTGLLPRAWLRPTTLLIAGNKSTDSGHVGSLTDTSISSILAKANSVVVLNSESEEPLAQENNYPTITIDPGNGVSTNVAAIKGMYNVVVNPGNTGGGIVTLDPSSDYYGSTTLGCGTLVIEKFAPGGAASSLGSSLPVPGNLRVNRGTLRYIGPDATTDRSIEVIHGDKESFVVHNDNHLTITGLIDMPTGALFKTGGGTLSLFGAGSNIIGVVANKLNEDKFIALNANGDGPTSGLGAFVVLDGTVEWGVPGQTVLVGGGSGLAEAVIGGYTTTDGQEKPAYLDIHDGETYFDNYLVIGRQNGSVVTAPTPLESRLRIFGGFVQARNLSIGRNKQTYPAYKYKAKPRIEIWGGEFRVLSNTHIGDDIGGDSYITVSNGIFRSDAATAVFGNYSGGSTSVISVLAGGTFIAKAVDLGVSGKTYSTQTHSTIEVFSGGVYNATTTKASAGTGIVRLDGGTYRPLFASGISTLDANLNAIQIGVNGGIIHFPNAGALHVKKPISSAPGVGSNGGGLTIHGHANGVAVLVGTQSYSGSTILSNGTLVVAGTLPPTTDLTLIPDSLLTLTNSVTTHSVASLTIDAPSKVTPWDVAFGANAGVSSKLVINNTLTTLSSSLRVSLYNIADSQPLAVDGTYTLLQYPTTQAAAIDPLQVIIANPASGKHYNFTTAVSGANTLLQVTISDGAVGSVWINAAGGTWQSGANWQSGLPADQIGAVATFATEAQSGGATVTLSGSATVGGADISSTSPYTFSGDTLVLNNGATPANWLTRAGAHVVESDIRLDQPAAISTLLGSSQRIDGTISGSAPLTINAAGAGSGRVALTGANTFTGPLTIDGGTLEIDALSALNAASDDPANIRLGSGTLHFKGSTPLTITRGMTVDGVATLLHDCDITLQGGIKGSSGALIKRGSGTLTLAGSGTWELGVSASGFTKSEVFKLEDGNAPTKSYASLNLLEGKTVWGEPGQNINIGLNLWIGSKTTTNAGEEVTGELEINGGVTRLSGNLSVGINNGTPITAPTPLHPKMTINGGEVYVGTSFQMNYENAHKDDNQRAAQNLINSQAEFVINDGLLEVADTFYPSMTAGHDNCAYFTINGGIVRHVNPNEGIMVGTAEPAGKSVITINGGLLSTMQDFRVVRYDGETWFYFNGGTLRAADIQKGGGAGVVHVYFNGGVFQPIDAGMSADYRVMSNLAEVFIGTGGFIIDTSYLPEGFTYLIKQEMLHDPALTATPDGGFVKRGSGQVLVQVVAGNGYDFTGPVKVEGGILGITESVFARQSVEVAEDATLLTYSATKDQIVNNLKLGTSEVAGKVILDLAHNGTRGAPLVVSNTLEIAASNVEVVMHPVSTEAHVWHMPVGNATTVLVCKAGQTISANTFSGSLRFPNRTATFQKITLAGGAYNGWQAIVMSVTDQAAADASLWVENSNGGSWETAANWQANALPANQAATQVRFENAQSSALPVTLSGAKTLGQLKFDSPAGNGYALSGDAISLSEIAPDTPAIAVNSGSHAIATTLQTQEPMAVNTLSNATVAISGTIEGSGALLLNRSGSGGGTTVLTGQNSFTGGITVRSGRVVVDDLNDNGTSGPLGAGSDITIGPGTLHYVGPNTETDRSLILNPGTKKLTSIFRNDNDVTLRGTVNSVQGGFVKSGAGTLRLAGSGLNKLGSEHNNSGWSNLGFWPNNGDSPVPGGNTPGFPSVLVDEGRLVVGGPGQTISLVGELWIGCQSRGWLYTTNSATLDFMGGDLIMEATNHLTIGRSFLRTPGEDTFATFNIYGGNLFCGHIIIAYDSGTRNSSVKATLNLHNGTLTVAEQFRIGMEQGNLANPPMATLNVYGGKIIHQHASQGLSMGWSMDPACDSTVNLYGGLIDEKSLVRMARKTSVSRLNLHGGTLRAENIVHNDANGESHVLFDGGVYQPIGAATGQRTLQGLNSATISTNGAVIDTSYLFSSDPYTIQQPLLNDISLGQTPDGGLRKLGLGKLTLAGVNTFTGPVVVEQGTLIATQNDAIPQGLELHSGALLDVNGDVRTIKSVAGAGECINGTVRVTESLAPQTTLTVDNLTLGAGVTYVVGTDGLVKVEGELAAEGTGFVDLARGEGNPVAVPSSVVVMEYDTCNVNFTGWKVLNTGHAPGKVAMRLVRDESGPQKVLWAEFLYGGTLLILR